MSIRRIETGERMSQTVVHGNTVYTAGQVARSAAGASVTDQTRAILDQLDALLTEAGTDKSKLISATIYLQRDECGLGCLGQSRQYTGACLC